MRQHIDFDCVFHFALSLFITPYDQYSSYFYYGHCVIASSSSSYSVFAVRLHLYVKYEWRKQYFWIKVITVTNEIINRFPIVFFLSHTICLFVDAQFIFRGRFPSVNKKHQHKLHTAVGEFPAETGFSLMCHELRNFLFRIRFVRSSNCHVKGYMSKTAQFSKSTHTHTDFRT